MTSMSVPTSAFLIALAATKRAVAAAVLAVSAVGLSGAAATAAPGLPSSNVAWLAAAQDADIERAFAQARRENKPLLLYWGATWCPPCNQLKATLFNRAEFAALAASFVAVHVDGDRPGAQKLGQRFQASGYPTLLLLKSDGTEITRLPSGAEPERVLELMQMGMAGGRPLKAVLADVKAGRKVSAAEWRMLAFYSWSTDEAQLVARADLPPLLASLAETSQAGGSGASAEAATRLWLRALAASEAGKGLKPDAAQHERLRKLLADPAALRGVQDLLVGYADDVVRVLAPQPGAQRDALRAAFAPVLERVQADATLSRGDRMTALLARVELARLEVAQDEVRVSLPAALAAEVREHVARADREIGNGYERQAVITLAAHVLARAGLWSDSDALLKANLSRSHSAYYLMSQLGGNARKQQRHAEALDWYQQAWEKSEGPATRLQWGTGYLSALLELAPREVARIEKTASQLFGEALQDEGAFDGRSARGIQRASARLLSWNADGRNAAVLQRLRAQLDGLCKKVEAPPARSACDELLVAPKAPAAKG